MNKVTELRQRRSALIKEARELLNEDGSLKNAEDQAQYDRLFTKADELRQQADRLEQQERVERELAQPENAAVKPQADDQERASAPAFEWRSRGMQHVTGDVLDNGEWRRLLTTTTPEYRAGFENWLKHGKEFRALQADADIYGGYLVPPMQVVDNIIQAVDNAVFMRQFATVYSVPNADSLGVVSLDNDPADPAWTTELQIGTEDSTMSFGRRALHPHPLAKYIKISRTLLRKVPRAEGLVRDRLAYKFAVTLENAYMNGTGANQALGVFTASADGINTDRDASTGNTDTSIQFDGLIEAKYTLKPQYWARARWVFHRDAMKQIAKLKDGEGQYLWRESVRAGEPDRVLGLPAVMSEYVPNTFTTGLYVGILGDFSFYWIADSLQMEMQRLVELYAATNQVGLIGRFETDGMPVLSEAFVRVKLG
jgi:HK97 family phage major capsid protein